MAFTATTIWNVQTGGDDTNNGGGFDTGVAGFVSDWAIASANTSSPVVTSASYNFVAGDVGAMFFLKSGTNGIPGWYPIASVAANAATLNAAAGAGFLYNVSGGSFVNTNGTPTTATGCGTASSLTSQTGGIDFSQQSAAEISYNDMLVGGTTTQYTSAGNPVNKRIIGNTISVTSGATVQRVAVVSTSGTTATCDKSLGTAAQVGVGNLGGPLASLGLAGSLTVAGNIVFQKSGSYTFTSASTNVTAGCFAPAVNNVRLEGYGTVPGDLGTAPVNTASGISTFVFVTSPNNSDWYIANITVDCASLTSGKAFAIGRGIGYLLTAKNCTNSGFTANTSNPILVRCAATGCATQPAFTAYSAVLFCEAYSNTVTGFNENQSRASHVGCLSYSNSGASSDGFASTNNSNTVWIGCTAYGNGRDGFRSTVAAGQAVNCIAESNTGVGFNFTATAGNISASAVFSNGTNLTLTGNQTLRRNITTYTATAFVNAAGGNFALNGTSGGGASLRAAGIFGTSPDGLSVGYLDIGAFQSPPMLPRSRVFSGM